MDRRTVPWLGVMLLAMFVSLDSFVPLSIAPSWCLSPIYSVGERLSLTVALARQSGATTLAFAHWTGMVVTMVPVLAMAPLRFVAAHSFRERRVRAVCLFLVAALGVWVFAGLFPVVALQLAPLSDRSHVLLSSAGLLLAAAWQVTPWKSVALRGCHRTFPLLPRGRRADADCLRYGLGYGVHCFGSCWALMLACVLGPHDLLLMAAALCIAWHERSVRNPENWIYASVLLGGAAIVSTPLLVH